MTVKELIKKLQTCDQNAMVVVENDELYNSGVYKATEVESYEEGIVYIATNHEDLVEEY